MEALTIEKAIERSAEQELAPKKKKRRRAPLWVGLLCDMLLAGGLLCLFALYHHVLPQTYAVLEDPPIIESPAPEAPTDTSMGAKFAEKFTATVVRTDTSYSGPNVAFTIEKKTKGEGRDIITYYVADIYIRHIECFRTGLANNTYGKSLAEPLLKMAKDNNALLAVNGDYYGRHYGPVIRNGVLYRNSAGSGDVCVLYKDGTIKTFLKGTFNADNEMANGAWQAWCFGPTLLTEDGGMSTSFDSYLTPKHPRCAIGYYEPGHYAFVIVDGRDEGYSSGMTMVELSELFSTMGCTVAYNLDGGRTAQMAYNDAIVNQPYKNGRDISDIVYIGEVTE